jgi:hypothetical protein
VPPQTLTVVDVREMELIIHATARCSTCTRSLCHESKDPEKNHDADQDIGVRCPHLHQLPVCPQPQLPVLGQEEEKASARPSPFWPELKRLCSASARPTLFFRCYSLLNWRQWCRRRGTGEKDGDGARPMLFFRELKIMWKGKNEREHARSLYEQLFFGCIPCKQEDWDCSLYLLLSKY